MEKIIESFSLQISVLALKIGVGISVLFVFWILAVIFRKLILKIGDKALLNKNVALLFGRLAYTALIIVGVISAIGTMGVNISALVASLGLGGFALGFALKDALANVLAGVLILIYRPFQVSDTISVAGFEGKVLSIDLRYTILDGDKKTVLIPNSTLFNNPVVLINKV